jgi:nondiscriminating aspartyl-tRNA synthetase
MTRTLIRDLSTQVDQTATIQGWLHKKRLLGGLNFITVRDRSGIAQSLIEDKDEVEKLRGLQIGTVLALTGKVVADERAPGGAELHDVRVEVMVPVTDEPPIEIDKPLDHKSENLDTLFEHRVIGLRNIQESNIFRVQAAVKQAARNYFAQNEFVEFNSPKLLPAVSREISKLVVAVVAVKLLAPVTTKAPESVIAPPAATVRSPDTVDAARSIAAIEFKTTLKPEVMVTEPV